MAMERIKMAVVGPNAKQMKRAVKKDKRQITREARHIERDIKKNETEQNRVKAKMLKDAKAGNHDAVKQGAKQMIRLKNANKQLTNMKYSIENVGQQLTGMTTMMTMTETMGKTTKMMTKMNKQMNPQKFAQTMAKFQRESEKAQLTEELMEDALGALDDEEAEEELVDSILAEVGLEKLDGLGYVPIEDPNKEREANAAPQERQAVAVGGGDDEEEIDDLESRLRNLGGGN